MPLYRAITFSASHTKPILATSVAPFIAAGHCRVDKNIRASTTNQRSPASVFLFYRFGFLPGLTSRCILRHKIWARANSPSGGKPNAQGLAYAELSDMCAGLGRRAFRPSRVRGG